MRNKLASALAVFALFNSAVATAQTSTEGNASKSGSAADNFGPIYGTRNLASSPTTVVVSPGAQRQNSLSLAPSAIIAAQNLRTQPPADVTNYTAYVQNDELLAKIKSLTGQRYFDPTLPVLFAWNHVALDMTSIDHTTAGARMSINGQSVPVFEPTYAEQFGPPRSSRAMAIVHLAMFEAANAADQQFHSYQAPGASQDLRSQIVAQAGVANPTPQSVSIAAAISYAAYDTLKALYPKKTALLDVDLLKISIIVSAQEAAQSPANSPERLASGESVGHAAANVVLADRSNDGSDFNANQAPCATKPNTNPKAVPIPLCYEEYFQKAITSPKDALTWTSDPISGQTLKLGADWYRVKPFVASSGSFIRPGGIEVSPGELLARPKDGDQAITDGLILDGYGSKIPNPHGSGGMIYSKYGVKNFGGFSPPTGTTLNFPPSQGLRAITPTKRTDQQTLYAQFWGYDATALLCAPPRLYNMLAASFYLDKLDRSKFDSHAAVKAARYLALVNIAMADAGINAWTAKFQYLVARPVSYIRDRPSASHDNRLWTPLGQVASNGAVTNVTPPFPAWPSGHAVFGGAVFETIAKSLALKKEGSESSFDFVSDEFNGRTFGADGQVRPRIVAHYVSLAAAEWENAESRIWLGIHWQRDADDGDAFGEAIADTVVTTSLLPLTTTEH